MGRSNVGKSSLLNALTGGRRLARTSRTPGKTRTCNLFSVDDRYHLVDLPGYGYAAGSKSSRAALGQLVRTYFRERSPAGAVWLLDIRREPTAGDLAMGRLLTDRHVPVLVALTKTDKVAWGRRPARRDTIRQALSAELPEERCLFTSAKTGVGIPQLLEAIERLVDGVRN